MRGRLVWPSQVLGRRAVQAGNFVDGVYRTKVRGWSSLVLVNRSRKVVEEELIASLCRLVVPGSYYLSQNLSQFSPLVDRLRLLKKV